MSELLANGLQSKQLEEALSAPDASRLAVEIESLTGLRAYPRSISFHTGAIYFLARHDERKVIAVLSRNAIDTIRGSVRPVSTNEDVLNLVVGELDRGNAAVMRELFAFLKPVSLGLKKSAGCGDRLGLATPGHIRAVRKSSMAPILAQQSIRENARTGRSPQEVMDDALWGVFQEGWRSGFGADADHLKNTDDVDACVAAGFTFYTIDPGEFVDNDANTAPIEGLRQKVAALSWAELESSWDATMAALGRSPIDLGSTKVRISAEDLMRATAKYGRVVAHTVKMYRHLARAMNGRPFELEMSVDETETVTTVAEHIYIAHELKRLGVKWVSLAPRYVGDFEKGVDYIGDLSEFEKSFASHLAVARAFGPYKLSLHSGSDKFSIYPIASRLAGDLVHLKTAGTSYLEALRAIGEVNPELFREIVAFARDRYATDRASYHVSADVAKMPDINEWANGQLTDLLDDFHAREILHVTFGSVLHNPQFRERFFESLKRNEETYAEILERHFDRHLSPFEEAERAIGD
jgi:hypothetical protein